MIELVITEAANAHMKRSQRIISYAVQLSAPFCQEFFPRQAQTQPDRWCILKLFSLLHNFALIFALISSRRE